ncbi:MAG: M15 family metallopeptidase [Clostridia bacterium]|nr:M15 family metallopeptidase [Clostridia bacterium]
MKKLLSFILVFAISSGISGCGGFGDPTISVEQDVITNVSSETMSEDTSSQEEEEAGPIFDFNSWELRLVNPWNSIPEDFELQLATITSPYAGFAGASFDARAIEPLHALCADAKAAGINLTIISAYRTNEFQTNNFERKVNNVMAADPSLTREEAEAKAATVVARPGTSEHQVGLAVDFNSVEDSFKNTKEYAWLVENCTKYGFILRYTEEKQDITGIIPEPWHYRYVGVEAAKIMKEENLCLEEFIEKYNVTAADDTSSEAVQ